jgi:hypothetical protein
LVILRRLLKRKFYDKETYEEVIWDMIEDSEELNEQTKKQKNLDKLGWVGYLWFAILFS